jgi:tetratricopeptide (TPR) repeat protein
MTRSARIALVGLALSARIAVAEPTEAEKLYDQGQAAFDAKRFDDAITAWERSYELSDERGLLFNIGQAYRRRRGPGDCAKAAAAYKKFLELDATSDQRSLAQGFAAEMDKCVASERPAPPPIVTPPVAPAPVVVPSAEPAPHTSGTRIAGLAVAGGGVALLAVGIYYGHRASSLSDELTTTCASGCSWAEQSSKDADGRSAQTKQWLFDGLGAAAIVGGGVLFWLGSREESPIAITPRRDGAAITWSGSW